MSGTTIKQSTSSNDERSPIFNNNNVLPVPHMLRQGLITLYKYKQCRSAASNLINNHVHRRSVPWYEGTPRFGGYFDFLPLFLNRINDYGFM